ncbi:hypothetical protein GCM10007880_55550 [Mesorhizobium amorphae]|nr:hypothetical protein GCM10007880_55550 [Mesorhizobium amorphae]
MRAGGERASIREIENRLLAAIEAALPSRAGTAAPGRHLRPVAFVAELAHMPVISVLPSGQHRRAMTFDKGLRPRGPALARQSFKGAKRARRFRFAGCLLKMKRNVCRAESVEAGTDELGRNFCQ